MLFMSDPLPLRTADALGAFSQSIQLPHRIGDLTNSPFTLLKLNPTDYFAADHPMQITAIQVNNKEISGWKAATQTIGGVACTVVTLGAAADDAVVVTGCGWGVKGKHGAVIQNPADAVEYILSIAKKTFSPASIGSMRSRMTGVKVAGSLEGSKSTKAWVDEVTQSIGVLWTQNRFVQYPVPVPTPRLVLTGRDATLRNDPQLNSRYTGGNLRLQYDYSTAKARFEGVMVVGASGTPFDNMIEVNAGWLRQVALASILAIRWLTRLASGPVTLNVDVRIPSHSKGGLDAIAPGEFIGLALPNFTGTVFIMGREYAPGAQHASLICEALLLSPPKIRLVSHAIALPTETTPGAEVSFSGGVATFTITRPGTDGKPFVGANVSLDGAQAKKTDTQGKVTFQTKAGHHKMAVSAPEFNDLVVEFDL